MKYCKRCLYPENHPYGMIFDEQGICMGCRVHEEKNTIDWGQRFRKLKKIVDINTKNRGNKEFDCIIPVTGGGDSYFIVHTVKNVLGLNPLLVNYNSHFNTKVGIRNLANLTTVFDCDMLNSTLSPELVKKITKVTLQKYGSIYWHVLAGYLTFPVQIAVKFRIPLIIWGVQPWSEQTGMFSHLDESEMTDRCRLEHGLMGISPEELLNNEKLNYKDLLSFIYPDDKDIESVGLRGIYLSNYLRWDAKTQHEKMIDMYGYETSAQERTFNTYEDVHCVHSAGLHDYIKYLKLGYSKVTDHATREIRLGRMTREEGIQLVENYTEKKPSDLNIFLNWLNISEDFFYESINKFRDNRIWEYNKKKWILKDKVSNHIFDNGVENARINSYSDCNYRLTSGEKEVQKSTSYLLMGRGYIDKFNYGAIEDKPKGSMTKRIWKEEDLRK
jgi:N-acetyl sugar amidotransferase